MSEVTNVEEYDQSKNLKWMYEGTSCQCIEVTVLLVLLIGPLWITVLNEVQILRWDQEQK